MRTAKQLLVASFLTMLWVPLANAAERFTSYESFYSNKVHSTVQAVPFKTELDGNFVSLTIEKKTLILYQDRLEFKVAGKPRQPLRLVSFPFDKRVLGDIRQVDAYRVEGTSSGLCLEMPLTGLGKSGRFQRIRQLLVIPAFFQQVEAKEVAFAVTGLFASCQSVAVNDPGTVVKLLYLEPRSSQETIVSELAFSQAGVVIRAPMPYFLKIPNADNPYIFELTPF